MSNKKLLYRLRVKGVSYYNRQILLKELSIFESIFLKREPSNSFDKNAIAVINKEGSQLGYIPKEIAKDLAPLIDSGKNITATINNKFGGNGYRYGLEINIFNENDESNNPIKDINELISMAQKGDPVSQNDLGVLFFQEGSYEDAFHWFNLSAFQGFSMGQYNTGVMYDEGKGVDHNPSYAFYWFRKAAEQGNIEAQYNVATMYENGEGVKMDLSAALEWYKLAGNKGHKKSLHRLETFYSW